MNDFSQIPAKITAGDRVAIAMRVAGYTVDDWHLRLAVENGQTFEVFEGVADPTSGELTRWVLPTDSTKNYQSGDFSVTLYAEIRAEAADPTLYPVGTRQTIQRYRLKVLPDPSVSGQGIELRTYNERVLASLYAVMENKATRDQLNFAVNGQSLSRYSLEEVQTLINTYEWRVKHEEQRERIRSGRRNQNIVRIRS